MASSGAIGCPPPIDTPDGLGAEAEHGEPKQQLRFVRRGMAGTQAGKGEGACSARQLYDAACLLRWRHAGIALEADRLGRRGGIGGLGGATHSPNMRPGLYTGHAAARKGHSAGTKAPLI